MDTSLLLCLHVSHVFFGILFSGASGLLYDSQGEFTPRLDPRADASSSLILEFSVTCWIKSNVSTGSYASSDLAHELYFCIQILSLP